ncbi:MAG: CoA pyrophosphatase [Alphaproteobacteria bacterium]|nr:CoA pyrophosphatase [Alphaproteobacteria bacterium]
MSDLSTSRRRIEGSILNDPALMADASAPAPTGDFDLNPADRGIDRGWRPDGGRLRPAAVLVPLVLRDELTVLLTQRTEHLNHHAGQISFPGGRVEADDADPVDTALRETEEEIGLGRAHVEVAGYLDAYQTGTGFFITPVVGFVRPGFDLALDDFEVAEAFEVPLAFIFDPANHQRHSRLYNGTRRHYFAMPYGDYYIWGATAGMLMNLYRRVHGLV